MAKKQKPLIPPPPLLYTPKGSKQTAGSNQNSWENAAPYTKEQTDTGYGYVPPMTMNTGLVNKSIGPDGFNNAVSTLTRRSNVNSYTGTAADRMRERNLDFNKYISDGTYGAAAKTVPAAGALKNSDLPAYQSVTNDLLGTGFGFDLGLNKDTNQFGYVENGQQMWTGDLSGNKEALDYLGNTSNIGAGTNSLQSMWNGLGGAAGFADLASGLGSLYGIYDSYERNKMIKDQINAENAKVARQYAANASFNKALGETGLATGHRVTSPNQGA